MCPDNRGWYTAALLGAPIAIYAGAGNSGIDGDGEFATAERDEIKTAVRKHEIRLATATDAACEGLNPSRLEQRLGRIKRFGQRRQTAGGSLHGRPHALRPYRHRSAAPFVERLQR
ncbi:MAG: hypothetical protein OHK0044_04000 [Burkholderiaceae bacterium]